MDSAACARANTMRPTGANKPASDLSPYRHLITPPGVSQDAPAGSRHVSSSTFDCSSKWRSGTSPRETFISTTQRDRLSRARLRVEKNSRAEEP